MSDVDMEYRLPWEPAYAGFAWKLACWRAVVDGRASPLPVNDLLGDLSQASFDKRRAV